ncbi:MAG: serine hydroxymethyltransferase, partial [Rickettsiales bacterium]
EAALERAGLTCNKNAIPFDPASPFVTSGVRLGTPAGTTRGFGVKEFEQIGTLIADVLDGLSKNPEKPEENAAQEAKTKTEVKALTARFPIYS